MPNSQANSPADLRSQAHALCNAADTFRVQGHYAEAEPLYREALALAEKLFGPDHAEVSVILNNLAVLYKYTGKFDEAEALYQRALAITEKNLGPDHTEVAIIYHNFSGRIGSAPRAAA
jgi:tetratricopeptide (TPR) repeat protein